MPAPNLSEHERRIAVLEEHAEETLTAVHALADATHRGFTNVNADLDQALRLLQGLTGTIKDLKQHSTKRPSYTPKSGPSLPA
jgi:hypothetical protein